METHVRLVLERKILPPTKMGQSEYTEDDWLSDYAEDNPWEDSQNSAIKQWLNRAGGSYLALVRQNPME